jgi:hypothetical protein
MSNRVLRLRSGRATVEIRLGIEVVSTALDVSRMGAMSNRVLRLRLGRATVEIRLGIEVVSTALDVTRKVELQSPI